MNKSLNKRYGMAFIEPCTIFATAISKYLEEFRARLVVLEAYSDLRETIRQGSLNPSCCALLLNDDCLQDENAQAYLKALRDSNPKLQILALISQNTSLLESFIKAKLIDKWFDKGVSFDSLVVSILSYLDKIPTICTYKKPMIRNTPSTPSLFNPKTTRYGPPATTSPSIRRIVQPTGSSSLFGIRSQPMSSTDLPSENGCGNLTHAPWR